MLDSGSQPERRRKALSGVDSPRAPPTNRDIGVLDEDMFDPEPETRITLSPKVSPQMERLLYGGKLRTNPPLVRNPSSEAVKADRPTIQTNVPVDAGRRKALSGCDSPRAPVEGLVTSTVLNDSDGSPLPPLSSMLDGEPSQPSERRRKALSGMDSPRAPPARNAGFGNDSIGLGDMTVENPNSPLPPLSSMLDSGSQPESRRKALSGVDSPRAPPARWGSIDSPLRSTLVLSALLRNLATQPWP